MHYFASTLWSNGELAYQDHHAISAGTILDRRHQFQGLRYDGPADAMYTARFRDHNIGQSRWSQQHPAGYVDGANLYAYLDGNPTNKTDPVGLRGDIAIGIDIDIVPGFGIEFGGGVVFDTDRFFDSGLYYTGGPAGGANLGAGIMLTGTPGDIEGTSGQADLNLGKLGVGGGFCLSPNAEPVVSIGAGPGVGASASITTTTTVTIPEILGNVTDLILGGSYIWDLLP